MRFVANFVDIDRAEAFLNRAEARRGRCFEPEEVRRHLLHAGRWSAARSDR